MTGLQAVCSDFMYEAGLHAVVRSGKANLEDASARPLGPDEVAFAKHHERARIIEKSEKHDDKLTRALELEENESAATQMLGGLGEKIALELI